MDYDFTSLAAIDRALGRTQAPMSGMAACLAQAYPRRMFAGQPDWARDLLARLQ